jgi:putative tricarboxylic transport membrane protein
VTVRTAELLMAILMGVFSIYLMVKSAELPIGWVRGVGPGGGTWPFWLSAIMLASCVGITVNWFLKRGPVATSNKVYIERHVLGDVGLVAGALLVTIGLMSFAGVYVALPLFIAFYIRFMGKHSWALTAALTLGIPVVTFYFFEVTLKIILPKGFTEPLFIPLYKMFF